MKCLEWLVLHQIKAYLPSSLDPHQFAYRANRSTEDAIAIALHAALSHLEHRESYVRMLFIDYSSAFNIIILAILVSKLSDLGLNPLTCSWISDFLTNRPQKVKLGPHFSSTHTLSTGSPQGCVLSPLLYSLYTFDCSHTHPSNTIVKFADDTTVVGLISEGDESAYRDEILKLTLWCSDNNLALNTTKTKGIILDFRKNRADPASLYINGELCREGPHLPLPGHYDLCWPLLDCQHGGGRQEGSAAATLPQGAQEEQRGREAAGDLLPLLHPECSDVLHLSVVFTVH